MKASYEWKSGFAEAAQNYISLKQQTGMKFEVQERYLRHFDTFYYSNGFEGSTLTKEIVNDFIYDPNERPVTHHNKEVVMRDFAIYLAHRGYHAYVAEVKTKLPRCKFIPHIFTDDETRRMFITRGTVRVVGCYRHRYRDLSVITYYFSDKSLYPLNILKSNNIHL